MSSKSEPGLVPQKRALTEKQRAAVERNKFKPGQSGNPGGRPKKKPLTEALMEALDNPEHLKQVIEGILAKAKKGDVAAFAAIRDTTEGKPVESHEHSGKNGGPIIFTLKRIGDKETEG